MTAKKLLKFIDSIREMEEIDYIYDDLKNQRDDISVKLELEINYERYKKLKRDYADLAEKMEAIIMMKFQRLLFYKLAGF